MRCKSRREVGGTANVVACGVSPAADHIHNASIGHARDQARLMPPVSLEFLKKSAANLASLSLSARFGGVQGSRNCDTGSPRKDGGF